ncbi:uncharacterized protein LOC101215661 [Cucumis sativus]|uniref:Uncharacterized protein n=1 Tax=Cucumis sativus TaxID=3659 RepID=A0A0A0LD54_CUCSA|nr:uncharacterized protein LOC101215661 [Cucumis sativus]KGN58642.1 hypothetical protein Csa_002613 [Cucumis sativus]
MGFWHQMIFPVRRVWLAVYGRLKARRNDEGLLKLHDDVETCGYQDVKVMWEILRRSEAELINHHQMRRKHKPFWKALVWSNHNSNSSTNIPKMTNFPTFSPIS